MNTGSDFQHVLCTGPVSKHIFLRYCDSSEVHQYLDWLLIKQQGDTCAHATLHFRTHQVFPAAQKTLKKVTVIVWVKQTKRQQAYQIVPTAGTKESFGTLLSVFQPCPNPPAITIYTAGTKCLVSFQSKC